MVREGRTTRAEVHCVESARREVGDVRPRLLRPDVEISGRLQSAHRGRVRDYASRCAVTDDLERCAVRGEAREIGFRVGGLTVGRVAEIEGGGCLSRNHVVGDAGVEACHGDHLAELEPADDRRPRLELEERHEPAHGTLEGAVRKPGTRRVAARPVEREPRDDVAEAAGLQLEVGRLEDDRKRRLVNRGRAGEERGQRVVLGRQLLPAEQEKREVARRRSQIEVARQFERDGEPALHVARAKAVHLAVGHAPGNVALRRDRVVVGGKNDQREPVPPW
jgi:hypothetical protein